MIHEVFRHSPTTEPTNPSGNKGYIVLRKQCGTPVFQVTETPFKAVTVRRSLDEAAEYAEDGEFIVEIELPETEEEQP